MREAAWELVIISLHHLSPRGAGKQERSRAGSSVPAWGVLAGSKALLCGHSWGFESHFCPMLAQHEKYTDLFLTVRERGWLTPDVVLLFLPFFCCFPFYITDTTQVWLKIPYSRSLIAYMILRSVDFNAFFNEVGVGLRMCHLQNAVLFCLPLTCYPRSPSPSGFTCSWILCYMVS